MPLLPEIKKGIACDSVGKPDSIVGRAVCLSVHPGKMLLFPFLHWFHYHYKNRYKFARVVFSIDLLLIGIMLALGVVAIYAKFFLPGPFDTRIAFETTIAPREVITGAPSTIVIRYTNGTDEELRNTEFTITPPKHFLSQGDMHYALGTIPVGGTGNVHIKGVMFGDVGGEQAFQSKLTFVHGEDSDVFGEKIDFHVFSPTRSALALSLQLPERVIASQTIEGILRYDNTGEIDFPVVSILPEWPEGFVFTRADRPLRAGQFEIPTVKAGQRGEFHFEGVLQDPPEHVTFSFHPSFTFGDDRYRQETLTHTAPIVPLPIILTHTIDSTSVRPGSELSSTIQYKNIADFPISNVTIGIESNSPFLKPSSTKKIETIKPGEEGTITLTETLRTTLLQSETSVYEHLTLGTRAIATYTMDDGTGQQVTSKGKLVESPITTPIRFESFVRYQTEGGDQIGRGPVPPEIGEETTYWVFWHVGGTTNDLNNVRIEATLPTDVRFTGRQTVSQNGSVDYDQQTHSVIWTSNSISPTLSPTSKIVGAAFELGITPTAVDSTKPSTILKDIRLTATDGWTGAFVSASAKNALAVMKK